MSNLLASLESIVRDNVSERLTVRQLTILGIVVEETMHGNGVRELAHRLKCPKPSVTRACDRLTDLGLINRQTHLNDRRLVVLAPTRKGKSYWSGTAVELKKAA